MQGRAGHRRRGVQCPLEEKGEDPILKIGREGQHRDVGEVPAGQEGRQKVGGHLTVIGKPYSGGGECTLRARLTTKAHALTEVAQAMVVTATASMLRVRTALLGVLYSVLRY